MITIKKYEIENEKRQNEIRMIRMYDGHKWIDQSICVGVNTPVFRFISLLIEMNEINFKKRNNTNESNDNE